MFASRETNISENKSLKDLTTIYFENFLISCITIKTKGEKDYFGLFSEGRFIETLESKIVLKTWAEIPSAFHNCSLGSYGVSPNGFAGILKFDARLTDDISSKYISSVIGRFKSRTTRLLNQLHMKHSRIFWENGYTETPIENLNDLSNALNRINSHRI